VAMPKIRGTVSFRNMTFGYDKHTPVLHNIDLDVGAGEMIGFVGHSGAGKTTMTNLICRFYTADEGSILIDGVDIKKISLEDLRSQIGIVLQEPFLFNGTIAENIGYAKSGTTREEIMQAAKIANAHDFIVAFPDGYDTNAGERGQKLSGGERQRISIARAVLHNPRILILDEATSSVDTETEKRIQEALARLVKGRTTFAIAHRLSTLRNADRLMVLDKGKSAEVGTHSELMEKKGVYHKLVELQREMSNIKAVNG
jgi:ATP-binding cassette subfamily B protein